MLVVAALALALGACGSDGPASTGSLPPAVTTSTSSNEPTPDTVAVGAPIEIIGIFEAIEFYPACGNETLDHQGTTWYTLINAYGAVDPDLEARADAVLSVEREASPVMGRQSLVRVVEPGPGDSVGTLVVWADGVARWVSDSGNLDVWLIDDEIAYNWVC